MAGLVLLLPGARQRPQDELTPLVEVVQVVDGDTIHVRRGGRLEKLRLLSVDTEEKITGRPRTDALKPETVFGQETALWARAFFDELAPGEEAARVRLRFPGGEERLDAFGRLLCHVVLPDGRDFNVLLVELGKSPYFNKYGNSRIAHERFVKAQARARKRELGIWNPETNRSATPDAPEALRPYDLLLPWWDARAAAVEAFRRRTSASVVSAEDAGALQTALGRTIEVFGTIDRFFEEADGSLTARFRSGTGRQGFRAVLPGAARKGELEQMIRRSTAPLRQNYLFVRGTLEEGLRSFRMVGERAADWRLAGPEPR